MDNTPKTDGMPSRDSANDNLTVEALNRLTEAINGIVAQNNKSAKAAQDAQKRANNEMARKFAEQQENAIESLRRQSDELKKAFASGNKNKAGTISDNNEIIRQIKAEIKSNRDTYSKIDTRGANNKIRDELNEQNEKLKQILEQAEQDGENYEQSNALLSDLKGVGRDILVEFRNYANRTIKRYIDQIESSVTQLGTTYRSTYTAITARQGYTQNEYGKAINDIQDWIKTNNLTDQVSLNDILPKIEETLANGLRGQSAVLQAQYSAIASDVVPALDMNNRSLLQTVNSITKNGGDVSKFYEGLIGTITDTSDDLGNAFGVEAGIINQTVQGVGGMIKGLGLDETRSIKTYQAFIRATSALEAINVDSSALMTDFTNLLNKGVSSYSTHELMLLQNGVGAQQIFDAFDSGNEELINELLVKYGDTLRQEFAGVVKANGSVDVNSLNELNQVFQTGMSTNDLIAFLRGDIDIAEVLKNTGTDIGKYLSEYESGQYQLDNEKYQNKVTNLVDDATIGMENTFAYGTEMLADGINTGFSIVEKLLDTIIASIWANGIKGNGNGISGLFKNTTGQTLGSTMGKVGSFGTKFTGTAAKVAGVARVGGAVGGAIMMGTDAVSAWNNAREEGGTTGEALGKATIGAVTGVTKTPETAGQIAGTALKNTAKGAAIGTAILPGWGTAIGAGVGAVVSLTDSLIRYNSVQAKLERSAKNLDEAFQEAKQSNEEYIAGTKQVISNQEALDIASGKIEGDKNKALAQLKESYGDLLYNVKDLSTEDQSYVELVQYKIDKEKEALKESFSGNAKKSSEKQQKGISQGLNAIKTNDYNNISVAQDFLSQYDTIDKNSIQEYAKANDVSEQQVVAALNSVVDDGHFIEYNGFDGTVSYNKYYKDENGNYNYDAPVKATPEEIKTGVTGMRTAATEKKNSYDVQFTELVGQLNQFVTDFQTIFDNATTKEGLANVVLTNEIKKNAKSVWTDYNKAASDIQKKAKKLNGGQGVSDAELAKKINEFAGTTENVYTPKTLAKYVGETGGAFATGLEKVPYDNFPALLHKGERVQTSAEVTLQDMTQRISELVAKGTSPSIQQTTVNTDSPEVKEAIGTQTLTLSEKLDKLIELMTQLVNTPTKITEDKALTSYRSHSPNIAIFNN